MASYLFRADFLNTAEQIEKVKEHFEQELKSGNPACLTELVSEAPSEFKNQIAKELLIVEHQYYLAKSWTYDKNSRIRQFPQLEEFINELFSRQISSEEFETVRIVKTESAYKINSRAWKQGGQGTIHKGKNLTLGDREVVVKLLKDVSQRQQFEKEAYVTANLDHPGVVAVYSLGSEGSIQEQTNQTGRDCRPFYAMRLVRGDTFKERVEKFHKLKFKRRAGAFQAPEFKSLVAKLVSVCNTIEYAHSRGVLHCDIKPSNIKCGPFDATIVLDWGSATSFDAMADYHQDAAEPLTLNDWTAGSCTLEFASPEQIGLQAMPLSPASDVYSIGGTLYFLLAGVAPHDRERTPNSNPVCVSEVNDAIPKQLAGICRKATQLTNADRYQSAKELGNDLQNWLRDDAVSAMPDSVLERLFRWMRRHKGLTSTLALLILAVVSFILIYGSTQLKHARTLASRDAAFELIDKIVAKLGRDETSGSEEFRAIAGDLKNFGEEYIELGKDHEKLAKAHEILAAVHYFNYNATPPGSAKELKNALLDKAIAEYEMAEDVLSKTDSLDLASLRLKLARLNYKRLQNEAANSLGMIATARKPLDAAIEYFQTRESADRVESTDWFVHQLESAEAQHLSGEYYLSFRSVGEEGSNSKELTEQNLLRARDHFANGVNIREEVQVARASRGNSDENLDDHLLLRELGRGHGYLGDAQKYLGEYSESLRSYSASLDDRVELANKSPDVEYQFQLARGWANFGTFLRDLGNVSELDESGQYQSTFFEEFNNQLGSELVSYSLEDFVLKNYVNKAIKIRKGLFNSIPDERVRSDLASIYNLAAELHYFAYLTEQKLIIETLEESEKTMIQCSVIEHLGMAIDLASKAAALYPNNDSLTPSRKNTKAVSRMVYIQASMTRGEDVDRQEIDAYCQEIVELTNAFDGGIQFEPLFAYCVSLKIANRPAELKNAITRLRELSVLEEDYRILQHFPGN